MDMFSKNFYRGFTLIELLVVIAVVSVLAGAVIVIINPSAQLGRARDAQRQQDLRGMANALEQYVTVNGTYPVTGVGVWYSSDPTSGIFPNNNGNWIPNLTPAFIKKLPSDPKGGVSTISNCVAGSYKREYLYRSDDGTSYKLLAHCAPETAGWTATHPFNDPNRTYSWMVCSGAGCGW